MGEIADYYIERMLEDHFAYRDGGEYEGQYETFCNRCGESGS
jgi:hypothetical protein